jgi:hypothetical protein
VEEEADVDVNGDGDGEGWMEVGKVGKGGKRRVVVTRTVRVYALSCFRLMGFYADYLPFSFIFFYFFVVQIKTTESPISKLFGGKFRSTLRAPGQKDSSIIEDWRSLRVDIQVNSYWPSCLITTDADATFSPL